MSRQIVAVRSRLTTGWDTVSFDVNSRLHSLRRAIEEAEHPEIRRHIPVSAIAALQTMAKGLVVVLVEMGEPYSAPLLERKRMPLPAGTGWGNEVDYARFYFDGLTSHIHLPQGASLEQEYLRSCLGLGPDKGTIVFGHRFEESRAWENIKEMSDTVAREERTLPSTISALASATREYLDTSLQTRRPKDH